MQEYPPLVIEAFDTDFFLRVLGLMPTMQSTVKAEGIEYGEACWSERQWTVSKQKKEAKM